MMRNFFSRWRGVSPHVVPCCRFVSIGGRRTRGGFSKPLGKSPQVKQGVTEGVPRVIPGTTKVTYTNKKGRSFVFSVPVAEITHPPVNLVNASGNWRKIDTSFCDLGDIEDDMPLTVDEYLNTTSPSRPSDVCKAFLSLCKEYVLMDTDGMKTTHTYEELNVGPDYQHYDRKLRRKRHWLAICRRFEDVRSIIWALPEDYGMSSSGTDSNGDMEFLTADHMLEALLWLQAASTFCVRKMHPADFADQSEFLPLDLNREVRVVAKQVQKDRNFFSGDASLDRYVSCAALCTNHGVPFSSFFDPEILPVGDLTCILTNAPVATTAFGAIRLMNAIISAEEKNILSFSNESGMVLQRDIMLGLTRLMNPEAIGDKDALDNVGEEELITLMHFCVNVKEQNSAFFACENCNDDEGVSTLKQRYAQVSQLALARCRHLLYRLDGPRTQVMDEGGYIPLVELQKHTERTHKNAIIHYNLGIRSAQGLRRVSFGPQSSARLAELVESLETDISRVHGNTLVMDLLQHLTQKTATSKMTLTLREVNKILPLLARAQTESQECVNHTRFVRLFAAMSTAIGVAMQQEQSFEDLAVLVEGLALCHFLPSSFRQVEMMLLRLMLSPACSELIVIRILHALSFLRARSGVSPALLQAAASRVTNFADKSMSDMPITTEELVRILYALQSCKYVALPGLVLLCRDKALIDETQLSPRGRCRYASLLVSAAGAMQFENEPISLTLAEHSRRLFVEYAKATVETDSQCYVDCVTSLAALDLAKSAVDKDMVRSLVTYLSSDCITTKFCASLGACATATVLESVLEWCRVLVQPHDVAVLAPLEEALLARLRASSDTEGEVFDELAEAASRLVGMQNAADALRRAAAEVLGIAILRAEVRIEESQQRAAATGSFETIALASAERERNGMDTLLRYGAALQQSGIPIHAEKVTL